MPTAAIQPSDAGRLQRRRNNFDVVRLVLAYAVVVGHTAFLYGAQNFQAYYFVGDIAVPAFFVISGFLVSMSYSTSRTSADYYIRRILRIYPLYIAVVLSQTVAVLLVAVWTTRIPVRHIFRYIVANAMFANFVVPTIDGLFNGLRIHAVNGSLWTLKIEVGFYLILPVIAWAVRKYGVRVLMAIFVLSAVYSILMKIYFSETMARQLPGQLRFFVVGMMLYEFGPSLTRWSRLYTMFATVAIILALLSRLNLLCYTIGYPIFVGIAAFCIAFGPAIWRPRRDISYGVYLVHFPIIQLFLYFGAAKWPLSIFAPFVFLLATVLALVAHRAIERPAIDFGRRLIAARAARPPAYAPRR